MSISSVVMAFYIPFHFLPGFDPAPHSLPGRHRPSVRYRARDPGRPRIAAERDDGIERVAEELPTAGRGLVALGADASATAVDGHRGRHQAGNAGEPLAVAGNQRGIGGEHGQRSDGVT